MRILFVEDEEAIRGFVRINLRRGGMEVTEAEDGESALVLARTASPPFDVALLDVMLPKMSGFEVCEQLRQQFPRMGIIMLTAKSQEEDKIRGLELGADDYVQKPFSPGELVARLHALRRRMLPLEDAGAGAAGQGPSAAASGSGGAAAGVNADGSAAAGAGTASSESGSGAAAGTRAAGASAGASAPGSTASESGGTDAGASAGVSAAAGAGTAAGDSPPPLGAFPAPSAAAPSSASAALSEQPAAQARRSSELRSGSFRLSSAERKLWKEGVEIVLTPTEWTLVKLLMEREGEGLSRDDILNSVWGRHYVGDLKIVDVNIRRIRQKIEINPSEPHHIETLWGFGYRWKRGEEQ
ncbi:response regulator transcription factor [Paenibacillus sp. OV219]|uniref:response regulator transcription factor n=1 Tax=Paenibacillus sp. OV219 TaxID=1884377 RepID=UPI0008B3617F|nr:Transcriptional regulatory protein, C terminal [Paenibacillus sp. OV219]